MSRILLFVLLASLLGISIGQAQKLPAQKVDATIVWAAARADIRVSYVRDHEGVGSLQFEDVATLKPLTVKYVAEGGESGIADMRLAGISQFNDILIVDMETATGFLIKAFLYDGKAMEVRQVVNSGSRRLPELLYFGDAASPAIGVLDVQVNSHVQGGMICGETFYVYDAQGQHMREVKGEWKGPGSEATPKSPKDLCTK
jgi:hypothetical protein